MALLIMKHIEDKKRLVLIFIILVLIARLSILIIAYFHSERTLTNDSISYIEPAHYLLHDRVYTYPSALRTPVYPMFLALVYRIFGEDQFYVVVIQVILGLLTIYLTYKLNLELFPDQQNLTGIMLLTFGLESILSPFYVMTETLFTCLLVGVALAFLAYHRTMDYWWLIACGVLTGLTILCRPIALYIPGIILFLLIWQYHHNMKQVVISGAVYMFMISACVVPWIIRNDRVVGVPVVSTITGDSLLFYSANALVAYQHQIGFFDAQKEMYIALDQALSDANLPNNELNRYHMEVFMARGILRQAPVTYFYIHIRDSLKVFLPGTTSLREILGQTDQGIDLWDILQTQGIIPAFREYFQRTYGLQLLLIPFVIILYMTCLGGSVGVFVLMKNRSWFELAILFLPVIYLTILSGPGAYSRFRIPFMPFLSILAGIGIEFVLDKCGKKNK